MKYRVEIITVLASEQKAITQVQQKINQWMTIGLLKKYEILSCGENIIFNILLKKVEAE